MPVSWGCRPVAALSLGLLAGTLAPHHAAAQTAFGSGIEVSGEAELGLRLDRIGARDGRRAYVNIHPEVEATLDVRLGAGFGIVAQFTAEQRDFETTGSSRSFRDGVAYVEQLYLRYTARPLELQVGKIHPRFGLAWDVGPGLYGKEFGERYELTEQIGAAVDISLSDLFGLPPGFGTNSLRAEAFQADRSFLSVGLLNRRFSVTDEISGTPGRRARNRLAFGGPGNTEGFENFVVSLAGEGLEPGFGAIRYNLAYAHRRPGFDTRSAGIGATEHGLVAGIAYEFRPISAVKVTPFVEAVRQENADAARGARRDTVVVGASAGYRNVTLSYVYGDQRDRGGAAPGRAIQHAAGVDIGLGDLLPSRLFPDLTVSLGYRRLREGGVASNDFGAAVTWSYRF